MNLEQIDTSTTAGKAEVMRLAAEGRRVVQCQLQVREGSWIENRKPRWAWDSFRYAIISEPVGPEELWAVQLSGRIASFDGRDFAERLAESKGGTVVRYLRADLAGEKG